MIGTPSIWTSMCRRRPLCEALRVLCACGWNTFEISTEHLCEIEADASPDARIGEARELMESLGASAPQAHGLLKANVASFDAAERAEHRERLARHVEIAAQLGARVIVMHPGGRQGFATRAERERIRELNIKAFRRLGDLAAGRDMRIGLENTPRGKPTPPGLLDFLAAIDHPAMGVTFDTSHANMIDLDIPAAVRELGPHLVAVHVSDNDGSGDQHRFPGCGTVDWPGFMAALGEVGFAAPLNFEIGGECHPDPEILQIKIRYARHLADCLIEMAKKNGPNPAG